MASLMYDLSMGVTMVVVVERRRWWKSKERVTSDNSSIDTDSHAHAARHK